MGWEKEKRGGAGGGLKAEEGENGRTGGKKKFLAVFGQTEREKKEEGEGGKITDAQKGKTKKKNRRNWAAINHRCEEGILFLPSSFALRAAYSVHNICSKLYYSTRREKSFPDR